MLRGPYEPRSIHKPPTVFCISTQKAEYMALSKRLDTQKYKYYFKLQMKIHQIVKWEHYFFIIFITKFLLSDRK